MALSPYTGNIPNRLTGAATFSADVDYYHSYFTPFVTQFNADIAALNLNSVQDTSASSVTIGTGNKAFTVGIGKSFQAGQWLIFADVTAPDVNSMVAQVVSYNSGTGALIANCKVYIGSGTFTSWVISLTTAPIYGASGRTFLDIKQLQSLSYAFSSGSLLLYLNATNLDFRSTTMSSATPTNVVTSSTLLGMVSAGSTLGTTSGVQSDIIILAINNAGTMELAWCNAQYATLNNFTFDESTLITTVSDFGSGAADNANVIYSTTARTNVAYRVVGLFRSTQATAGTWVTAPSLFQSNREFLSTLLTKRSVIDNLSPAFSAYRTGNQSIPSATVSKVQINTKEFDLKNNFDNSSTYRFIPTVAGLYNVNFSVCATSSTGITRLFSSVYKNGVELKRGNDVPGTSLQSVGAALIQMNGVTDYIELFAYLGATTPIIDGGAQLTYFQASLVTAL